MYDFMQNLPDAELKNSCFTAETPFLPLDADGWAPEDCHPGFWVLECYSGSGIGFRSGDPAETPWLPDQWNLYPPGTRYAVRFREPEQRYENLWLLFRADLNFPTGRVLRFRDRDKLLREKVREIHFMRLAGDMCPAELVRQKLRTLLAELALSLHRAEASGIADFIRWDTLAADRDDNLLQRTDWLLRKHPHHPPTVAELAATLGMSVSGYSHRLKQESGWSPVDRIRYIRIEYAKQLLRQSAPHDAIRHTVWRLGFRSRQYFNYVFKQETGMTPGEFIRFGAPDRKKQEDGL